MTARPSNADTLISFRADQDMKERISAHLERMRALMPGVSFSQSDALRSLVETALRQAESKNGGRKK